MTCADRSGDEVGAVGHPTGSPAFDDPGGGPGGLPDGDSGPSILDTVVGWGRDRVDDLQDWREEMHAGRELVAELLGLDPDEQAARWDELTDEQRAELLEMYPEAVMRMEGLDPDESVGGARAEVAGELVLGDGNEFQSLTLSAEVGGSVPLDSLGFDLPGGDGGQAASVDFSIDRDNPYAPEITEAFASGDIGRATSLAAEHGRVVVTTSAVATGTSEEGEIRVLGVEYEYGTEVSTSTSVHIRPPGGDDFHHVYGPGADEGIGT